MKKVLKIKKFMMILLISILMVNTFTLNIFAESSAELPENFGELSPKEQHIWILENMPQTRVVIQGENITHSQTRNVGGARNYYAASRSTYFSDYNAPLFKLSARYDWSVEEANPNTTLFVDNVTAQIYDYYGMFPSLARKTVSKYMILSDVGGASAQGTFYHASGVVDLYQYAALYTNGYAYINEIGGTTS